MLSLWSDMVQVLDQLGGKLIKKSVVSKIGEISLADVEQSRERSIDWDTRIQSKGGIYCQVVCILRARNSKKSRDKPVVDAQDVQGNAQFCHSHFLLLEVPLWKKQWHFS